MKRITIFKLFLLLVSSAIFSSCADNTTGNDENRQFYEDARNYLQNHYQALDLNADKALGPIYGKAAQGNSIFLLGSYYGVGYNHAIRMKALKYFKNESNFKYLIIETGHSTAQFLNSYLATGNTGTLDYVFNHMEGTLYWTRERYEFFKDLYEYNNTLSENDKITCVGIDVEQVLVHAVDYLNQFLDSGVEPPQNIKDDIDKLKMFKSEGEYDYTEIKNFAAGFFDNVTQYRDDYETYLPADSYDVFHSVAQNLVRKFQYDQLQGINEWEMNRRREAAMFDNFLFFDEYYPGNDKKYFGQMMASHVFQSQVDNLTWFAGYLTADGSSYHGKVHSTVFLYRDCTALTIKNGEYATGEYGNYSFSEEVFNKYADTDITMFRLNGENSPFSEEIQGYGIFNGRTTDYCQYIILVKNSEAETELGN